MKYLLALACVATLSSATAIAQDYEDDIYYNPKNDKSAKSATARKSNYISDMGAMDVDTYNRRGQYYTTPIDTIGGSVENGEDFVYTQQIQKYYNPTIVLDNASALADVLANSYGNVNIYINDNGYPVFGPYNSVYWSYGWPRYGSWSWNWGWGPSWSIGWGWNSPWYPSWGYDWAWSPSWGWGPSWDYGWGWGGPVWGGSHRHYADYTPHGNRVTGPRPGWSANTRPGGNYNGGGGRKYGSYARPGSTTGIGRYPANNNGHRVYGTHQTRPDGINVNKGTNSTTVNKGGHRVYNQNRGNGNVNKETRHSTYNRESNSMRNYENNRGYNNRSYNNQNRGGYNNSGGGHRSYGGGGRGRHR